VFDSWLIFGSDIQTLPIKGTKWKKKKKKKKEKRIAILKLVAFVCASFKPLSFHEGRIYNSIFLSLYAKVRPLV
jgi:hypothetical protein